jgi:hypothetical protein
MDNGQEPCVDFKMSNFKPKVCTWLHVAWMKVKDMMNMIVKGWDKTWFTKTFKPNFNLMHWRLMLLHHCSHLLKHWGANGRRFGWWPYIVNISNYGRVYVGFIYFSLVINYTCMNTSKSKMKKLVKKNMWKKARVTYCSILSKIP